MWQVAMVLDNTAKNYQSYFQNTSFSKKKKKERNQHWESPNSLFITWNTLEIVSFPEH